MFLVAPLRRWRASRRWQRGLNAAGAGLFVWLAARLALVERDMSAVPGATAALATVGETFTQRARFSDDEIRAFATSVHDHNPLHHDSPRRAPPAIAA